jgi:hypothetical protein
MSIFVSSPLNIYDYQREAFKKIQNKISSLLHCIGVFKKLWLRNLNFKQLFIRIFVCSNNGKSSKEKNRQNCLFINGKITQECA